MALELGDGRVFAGRYRVVRRIASGGMGAVYEAVHAVTGRRTALKVMLAHALGNERMRARFLQEARVAAQVRGEHIVDVLDAGVDDETAMPFLVMELLEGEDLGQRLSRLERLAPDEVVAHLWQAAVALDRMHAEAIVHRDLKPRNLFVTWRGDATSSLKILDFGVAKMLPREAASQGATQGVGTPSYMAPEQFHSETRVSAATDIHALGMIAYTLLVGEQYYKPESERCENPFELANLIAKGPSEPASVRAERAGAALSLEFDAWFARATALRPADRFQSASVAVDSLGSALGFEDAPADIAARARPPQPPSLGTAPKGEPTASAASSGAVGGILETETHVSRPALRDATQQPVTVTDGVGTEPRRSRRVLLGAALAAVGAIAVASVKLGVGPSAPTPPAPDPVAPAPLATVAARAAAPEVAASRSAAELAVPIESLPVASSTPAAASSRRGGADAGVVEPSSKELAPFPDTKPGDPKPRGHEKLYSRH